MLDFFVDSGRMREKTVESVVDVYCNCGFFEKKYSGFRIYQKNRGILTALGKCTNYVGYEERLE